MSIHLKSKVIAHELNVRLCEQLVVVQVVVRVIASGPDFDRAARRAVEEMFKMFKNRGGGKAFSLDILEGRMSGARKQSQGGTYMAAARKQFSTRFRRAVT